MRRPLGIVVALIGLAFPSVVWHRKVSRSSICFCKAPSRKLNRQQQLEYERHRRQEMNRLHELFLAQWNACFRDDVAACNEALAHPYLHSGDRRRLLAKRTDILGTRREAAERAHRDRVEAEYLERQRQRERELQAERDRERQREQELAQLRQEAEQQRQRAEQAERQQQSRPRVAAVAQTQSLQTANPQDAQLPIVGVDRSFHRRYGNRVWFSPNVFIKPLMDRLSKSAPGRFYDASSIRAWTSGSTESKFPRRILCRRHERSRAIRQARWPRWSSRTPTSRRCARPIRRPRGPRRSQAPSTRLLWLKAARRRPEELDPDAILEGEDGRKIPLATASTS